MADLVRRYDRQTGVLGTGFAMFAINRTPGHGTLGDAQVFYDIDHLRRQWGAFLRLVAVVPEGLGGLQTVVVLEK